MEVNYISIIYELYKYPKKYLNYSEGEPGICSAYSNGYCTNKIKYNEFQPCEHRGCLSHISHSCEGCGRIGGDGIIYELCDYCVDIKN
jgi:hypothetical protein